MIENSVSVIDISSEEAWGILVSNPDATLVDVRSEVEALLVGRPNLRPIEKVSSLIPWQLYPGSAVNKDFEKSISETFPNKENSILLFICKSGGRSALAADLAIKLGYKHCYNIEDGFEGTIDSFGQRGHISGWKFAKLPWEQS